MVFYILSRITELKALLNCKFPSYRLLIDYMTILMLSKIFTPLKNEIMTSLRIVYNVQVKFFMLLNSQDWTNTGISFIFLTVNL